MVFPDFLSCIISELRGHLFGALLLQSLNECLVISPCILYHKIVMHFYTPSTAIKIRIVIVIVLSHCAFGGCQEPKYAIAVGPVGSGDDAITRCGKNQKSVF